MEHGKQIAGDTVEQRLEPAEAGGQGACGEKHHRRDREWTHTESDHSNGLSAVQSLAGGYTGYFLREEGGLAGPVIQQHTGGFTYELQKCNYLIGKQDPEPEVSGADLSTGTVSVLKGGLRNQSSFSDFKQLSSKNLVC